MMVNSDFQPIRYLRPEAIKDFLNGLARRDCQLEFGTIADPLRTRAPFFSFLSRERETYHGTADLCTFADPTCEDNSGIIVARLDLRTFRHRGYDRDEREALTLDFLYPLGLVVGGAIYSGRISLGSNMPLKEDQNPAIDYNGSVRLFYKNRKRIEPISGQASKIELALNSISNIINGSLPA